MLTATKATELLTTQPRLMQPLPMGIGVGLLPADLHLLLLPWYSLESRAELPLTIFRCTFLRGPISSLRQLWTTTSPSSLEIRIALPWSKQLPTSMARGSSTAISIKAMDSRGLSTPTYSGDRSAISSSISPLSPPLPTSAPYIGRLDRRPASRMLSSRCLPHRAHRRGTLRRKRVRRFHD